MIASHSLAEASLGQLQPRAVKKAPANRTAKAVADQRLAPEPR